jgi:threonine dehydrogenase-like Zn-dependent dehydrogenase
MRAAFMTAVDEVEVRETEEPALDPRGAILRVEACGVCGTDARTFFNGDPRAPAPWILGHEPSVSWRRWERTPSCRQTSRRATACSSARS